MGTVWPLQEVQLVNARGQDGMERPSTRRQEVQQGVGRYDSWGTKAVRACSRVAVIGVLMAGSVLGGSLRGYPARGWSGSWASGVGIAQAAEPVTIRVVSVLDPGESQLRQRIAQAFEKTHPNIKVQLLPVSNRVDEQLVRIAGGDPPDVLYLNQSFFGSFVHQGILLDLMPYVKRDKVDLSKLYASFVSQLQENGKLYAMPMEVTSIAMLYNQDAFDSAGLPTPSTKWNDDRWNWDSFLQAARKLTADTNGDGQKDRWGVGLILGALDQITYPWVFQNGGEIFDDKANKFLLNSEPSVEALQWLADLINKEKVALGPIWGGDAFKKETAAMYPYGRWLSQFQDAKFRWNVAPLPKGRQAATVLIWLAYGIAANARHKEEAWEFLKFLITPEIQAVNTAEGQALSALPELEQLPMFQNAPPRGHYGVFAGGIPYAHPVPYADNNGPISTAIWNALYPVWLGKTTAKQAMDSIAGRVENLLKASAKGTVSPTAQKR